MSGTIGPADASGATDAAAATGERPHPSIIPNVAEQARTGSAKAAKVAFAAVGLALVAAFILVFSRVIHRSPQAELPRAARPAVGSTSGAAKKFDTVPPSAAAAAGQGLPAVPAISDAEDDPIGVRRTTPNAGHAEGTRARPPASAVPARRSEDAPILLTRPGASALAATASGATAVDVGAADPLAETQANLADYRHQLGRSLEQLQVMASGAAAQPGQQAPSALAPSMTSVAAGTAGSRDVLGMQASDTPAARAGLLGNRSLVLPKGTTLTCALNTRIVSAQSGFISCQVLRNVFGSDGRVLLVERGSHLDGEYRVTQVKPGSTRIPALWTRLRTPQGITVDLDSPATGPLGESGADAYVDNRWFERIGAAMLVSVLDDSIKIVLNNETAPQTGNSPVVFQGTAQTASHTAEKVLDATINLPPLLYANQGALVGVFVARDVDFSSVYELRPVEGPRP